MGETSKFTQATEDFLGQVANVIESINQDLKNDSDPKTADDVCSKGVLALSRLITNYVKSTTNLKEKRDALDLIAGSELQQVEFNLYLNGKILKTETSLQGFFENIIKLANETLQSQVEEPEPEPVIEVSPVVEPEPEPEPVVEYEPEPEPVFEQESMVETETVMELEPEAEEEVVAEPVVEPEPIVEPEPVVQPEPVVEPEPVLEPEPVVQPEPPKAKPAKAKQPKVEAPKVEPPPVSYTEQVSYSSNDLLIEIGRYFDELQNLSEKMDTFMNAQSGAIYGTIPAAIKSYLWRTENSNISEEEKKATLLQIKEGIEKADLAGNKMEVYNEIQNVLPGRFQLPTLSVPASAPYAGQMSQTSQDFIAEAEQFLKRVHNLAYLMAEVRHLEHNIRYVSIPTVIRNYLVDAVSAGASKEERYQVLLQVRNLLEKTTDFSNRKSEIFAVIQGELPLDLKLPPLNK